MADSYDEVVSEMEKVSSSTLYLTFHRKTVIVDVCSQEMIPGLGFGVERNLCL